MSAQSIKRAVKRSLLTVVGVGDVIGIAVRSHWSAHPLGTPSRAFLEAIRRDSDALARAIDGVDEIVAGERRCFSLRWTFLSSSDWHLDPYSGRRWPRLPARTIDVNEALGDSDVQSPWETSRLEHVWRVALAAWHRRSPELAAWVVAELNAWDRANRAGLGVNWTVEMEVAMRALAIAEARAALEDVGLWPEKAEATVARMLRQHVLWVFDHLPDWGAGTQNHYFTCIVVLLGLGAHLPGFDLLAKRRDWLLGELARVLDEQVYPDGVDFENAVGYQLFVTELVGFALLWIAEQGWEEPPNLRGRLEAMVRYSAAMRWTNGAPIGIGDDDDDFIAPSACGYFEPGRPDVARSVWVACVALGLRGLGDVEVPAQFPIGGIYVLGGGKMRVAVDVMNTGVNGTGPHRHNDPLSFCLEVAGRPVVTDRGTYRYQSALGARQRFRSVRSHSCVCIDGAEPNPIDGLFALAVDRMRVEVTSVKLADEEQRISAEYTVATPSAGAVVHSRTWTVVEDTLVMIDTFSGGGRHDFVSRLPLVPGLEPLVTSVSPEEWEVQAGPVEITFACRGALGSEARVEESFHSPAYRVEVPAWTVALSWTGDTSCSVETTFVKARSRR